MSEIENPVEVITSNNFAKGIADTIQILPETPKEMWVITGDIYLDRGAQSVLQTPIGPFYSPEDANMFMWKMKPTWGSWEINQIHSPKDSALRADREGAWREDT